MLGKLAKGAKNLASDAAHTVVGDFGREAIHKLNNAVGSDRVLYRHPKKFTVTEDDVRRVTALKKRTEKELKLADIYYQSLSDAASNRVNTDSLYFQAASNIAKGHVVLEAENLDHQLALTKAQSQIAGKRREIAGILEADAQAEMMAVISTYQTIDVQAQPVNPHQQHQAGQHPYGGV
jgi:prophage tail gpP-like protein